MLLLLHYLALSLVMIAPSSVLCLLPGRHYHVETLPAAGPDRTTIMSKLSRRRSTRATARAATRGSDPQRLILGTIPRYLPTAERWHSGAFRTIVSPHLIATDLWSEPPTAEAGTVAVIPKVDENTDTALRSLLFIEGLPMITSLHHVRTLDYVGDHWGLTSTNVKVLR